eukprot:CAMPEP_0174742246 /NCGR_PEP_ID=MMETSP1094-20130205/78351_1 /TAXON_ID=156173 /ORGANISM="Chrysochromulina brevifilum, Strain UTEX LB 985" /LENGTH=75 /DNA_ID=CAMNT_0015946273 /DNA_START=130 /DNA_END=357 /DNA_ORIENTATION=-
MVTPVLVISPQLPSLAFAASTSAAAAAAASKSTSSALSVSTAERIPDSELICASSCLRFAPRACFTSASASSPRK